MKGVVLFGHGSRDPLWRAPMDAVAGRIAAQGVAVRCAFLELQQPDLATAVEQLTGEGAEDIVVLPLFLGAGRHVRDDLPRLVQDVMQAQPGVRLQLRAPVGEDPRLLDLLARIALDQG